MASALNDKQKSVVKKLCDIDNLVERLDIESNLGTKEDVVKNIRIMANEYNELAILIESLSDDDFYNVHNQGVLQ